MNSDGPTSRCMDAGSLFHDIGGVVLDDRGRIAFLRTADVNHANFVIVDQAGHVLREVALATDSKWAYRWEGPCWLQGSRFIVANVDNGTDPHSSPGGSTPTPEMSCRFPDLIARDFEVGAGFPTAVLWSWISNVIAFDNQGRQTWTLKSDDTGREPVRSSTSGTLPRRRATKSSFWNPAVPASNVLTAAVTIFATIDIVKAWGREPNYLASVTADVDGGFSSKISVAGPRLSA